MLLWFCRKRTVNSCIKEGWNQIRKTERKTVRQTDSRKKWKEERKKEQTNKGTNTSRIMRCWP
jgi:hypothetical protein